jgi:hypothetical protein
MISGKWNGSFVLGTDYPKELAGKEYDFDLDLECQSSGFTGFCNDSYTKELFDKPAIVSGNFDGKTITFTKVYPGSVLEDLDGKTVTMPKVKSQTIVYTGVATFHESGQPIEFEGEWLLTLQFRTWFGLRRKVSSTGTWRMKRPF